ncbi:hypothetical protein CPB83DRAFT_77719 [Crepidotus variabilis]|uniref:Uncharacterized protein n=1 Tax=Crepidotus variabilis TaxID=179855 RepID=A0A9P6EMK1_9AGAR|nr:hypothetical protein CPB83DRAFT_77719 [Crepidotus variabilis]
MGWLTFFSNVSQAKINTLPEGSTSKSSEEAHKPTEVTAKPSEPERVEETSTTDNLTEPEARSAKPGRRISFQSLPFARKHPAEHKPVLTAAEEHHKREQALKSAEAHSAKEKVSRSDKKAKKTALAVRVMIVGPSASAPRVTPTVVKPQLSKIKSQLMQPNSANRLIAQLRRLPAQESDSSTSERGGPIHAVCLEHTDAEEETLHFAKLTQKPETAEEATEAFALPGIGSAPIDQLTDLLKDMNVIDLIKSPDFGLGQPGDGSGILSGAVPTAETVINGVKQITPQLMALGFATGKALAPDHTGIYPPTDRMSVLTYWWGLELLLPPPSIAFLSNVSSVTGSVMNFLTAAALVNNGIREILPFIRYISQYIDFEFNSIKKVDQGDGAVCAATWIMPAAMVPRAWDFPVRPPSNDPTTPTPETGVGKSEEVKVPPIRGPGILIPPNQLPDTELPSSLLGIVASESKSPSPPPTATVTISPPITNPVSSPA